MAVGTVDIAAPAGGGRKPLVTPLRLAVLGGAVLLGLSLSLVTAALRETHTVHLTVAGEGVKTFRTRARTVGQALRQAGVELGPRDRVEPAPGTNLQSDTTVTVARAVPVRVRADGREWETWAWAPTVGQALVGVGIRLGPLDRVEPAPETPLAGAGDAPREIRVVRVREEETTQVVELPFGTVKREDWNLPAGHQREIRAGTPGEKELTIRIRYEDGVAVSRTVVAERVRRPPVDRIVAVGTAGTVSRGGQTLRYRQVLRMVATAYAPGDGYTPGSRTAAGLRAGKGVVAVDPRVIPLGSRLYIDGYGPAVAGDTGGSIRGNRIDLGFDTPPEARAFGRRTVTVYVLAR